MGKYQINPQRKITKLMTISIILLVILLSACVPATQDPGPPIATEPPAQATEKQIPDSPPPPQDTAPPATEPPPPSPTSTLEPTAPPTFTPMPYVMVSGNTNCRTGPGSVYDWLYTYLAGEEALILGKSADEAFWFISDQDGLIPDCWLWGKFATPAGDMAFIPVFTPPPTPTPNPDFSFTYEGSDCGAGSCWLWFKINNTGSIKWQSVLVYTRNTVTSFDTANVSNTFKDGMMGSDIDSIGVGGSGYTHSERLPNPSGNAVDVIVIVCEKDNLTEICQAKQLTVTP